MGTIPHQRSVSSCRALASLFKGLQRCRPFFFVRPAGRCPSPGGRSRFCHHCQANERMTTGTSNSGEHAAVGAGPGARRLPDTAREVAKAGSDPARQRPALASSDAAALCNALATSEQKLGAALRVIDDLQGQESFLKKKVALLSEAVAQARQFAYHDELTGLPNRRLLLDRFNQAIARGARQHKLVALLFLDLDGFKAINDALGHVAGDSLLKQVAARLSACVRTSDTACRFGGDEFVILLPELESRESAAAAARKIRAHLAASYFIGGTEIGVTTSVGMALYPVDGKAYDSRTSQCTGTRLAATLSRASGALRLLASPSFTDTFEADRRQGLHHPALGPSRARTRISRYVANRSGSSRSYSVLTTA
jgi:diguanylate cyclase (GGDEF)-like protein